MIRELGGNAGLIRESDYVWYARSCNKNKLLCLTTKEFINYFEKITNGGTKGSKQLIKKKKEDPN